MDQERFGGLTRALGAGISRRAGLVAALAALFGGSVGAPATEAAPAHKRRPKPEGPCGDGTRKENACTKNGQCCTGICNTRVGRKNKDGKGRCRCVRRGKACAEDRNCCNGMTCGNGVCGIADARCTTNGDCSGGTPICSGGTCVACALDTDCVGATPFCTDGACVACRDDSDCSGATNICRSGACRKPCSVDTDCSGDTPLCSPDVCLPAIWRNQTTFGSGPGTGDAEFGTNSGLALSTDLRTLLVADSFNNHRVSVWTRPGISGPDATNWTHQVNFGSQGTGPSNFNFPSSVALSVDGLTAWVADLHNNRISVWARTTSTGTDWSPETTFGTLGTGSDQFHEPRGIAVSANGLTVWVADLANNRISIWTRPNTSAGKTNWTNQTTFGTEGNGPNQLQYPHAVAVSEDALTAWIMDNSNNRVSIWTRPGSGSTSWTNQTTFGSGQAGGASEFNAPSDLAVSADGLTVWISDMQNNRVSIWTRPNAGSTTWTNQTRFGGLGVGPNDLSSPNGIAVSPDGGTAWVSDYGNRRISVWQPV